jgi:hypothetical protein
MASIRDLKKDVKSLINHFINECYTQLAFSAIVCQENTLDIISDALELRNDIIKKLNSRLKNDEGRGNKFYYNTIAEDFYKQIIELADRLHSLED